ncbi:DUF397 domain-containing protein [Streptomonospora algeriensis]|uniref:DUF397 domain-containing protein n=1 Tax=Streptomonospora algeriensis TaxID=995084 RepID=A0ABW3BDG2_9ACTN
MDDAAGPPRDLPPEAQGNSKWHDTTDAVWKRSSLSRDDSSAVVEVAKFDDGYRAVRDGKRPEKGTLFFTPAEWEAFVLGAKDGEFDIPEEYLTAEEAAIQRGEVPVTAVVSPALRDAGRTEEGTGGEPGAEEGGGRD